MPSFPYLFPQCRVAVVLLWLLTGAGAAAEGPLPIKRVLDDPEEYHLTAVTLEGTASEVAALEPYYSPSGAGCYGAYTFVLSDRTGALPVTVLGFCGIPLHRDPPIADGDHVRVEAHVRAPGHEGRYEGLVGVPIPESDADLLRVVANVITHAEPPDSHDETDQTDPEP